MTGESCHAPATGAPEATKALILKTLTVKKVAGWCGVDDATPYQWLSRGTEANPIPPAYVPAIVAGARAAGIAFDVGLLWPAMRGLA
jgi:hypothetical protein